MLRYLVLILLMLAAPISQAFACRPGCVPASDADEIADDTDPTFCGPGCVRRGSHGASPKEVPPAEPGETQPAPEAETQPQPEMGASETPGDGNSEAAPETGPLNVEATELRIVVVPTASGLKKGDTVITGYDFGIWEVQHGLTDNLQLGVVVPIGLFAYGLAPTLQVHAEVKDGLNLSAGGFLSLLGIYGNNASALTFSGGLSLAMTKKSGKHIFNIGIMGGSGGSLDSDANPVWSSMNGFVLIPHMGYRKAFHPNWSFQMEVAPLLIFMQPHDDLEFMEEIAPVLFFYGFRGHNDGLFGDIGFVIPFSTWFTDIFWKYAPFGFPYFSLGFHF